MGAIFGAPVCAAVFQGVYSRLKQFILDIYNGSGAVAAATAAYNADQLSATKIIIKKPGKMWRRAGIYCFNNGK